MKILYAKPSPYSAKVRMAARHLELPVEEAIVSTEEKPELLISNNPLGKIPVLIDDDGTAIFDSRAIMQHLNRVSVGKLFPRPARKRTDAEVMEALCDGITDCLLAIVYERRFRPADMQMQAWIDRQWEKVIRGLDHLEANPPRMAGRMNGGHFAAAAMIGYLDLRFTGQWDKGRPRLKRFIRTFARRFPDYEAYKPQT